MGSFILTEYKAAIHASQIKLHIYRMPIKDRENIDREYGTHTYQLRQKNRTTIAFYRSLIGSFKKLTDEPDGYEHYEYRPIKLDQSPESHQERKLLERLILRGLGDASRKEFFTNGQSIFEKKPFKYLSECKIYRGIHIDVTVKEHGDIMIGFELKHSIQSNQSISAALRQQELNKGDKVFDYINNAHFQFEGISDKTISDPLPDLNNKSILQHYETKPSIYNSLSKNPNAKAVLVRSKKGKVYHYAPQLLLKECLMKDVPPKEHSSVKLDPSEKINHSVKLMEKIIKAFKQQYFPIGFEPKSLNIGKSGYQCHSVPDPLLRIGNGATCKHQNLKVSLSRHKIFDSISSPVQYQLLLDSKFHQEWKKRIAEQFKHTLEKKSKQWGVELQSAGNPQFLPTSNPRSLEFLLKDIEFDSAVIYAVLLDENKQEESGIYSVFKKELGGNRGIHTQVILINSLKNEHTIPQILLGIYTKAGLQPWILHKPLHADCYVGYDVSHENGRHATGIVQVFGKDGSQIWSQPISSTEAGEKVSKSTIQSMVIHVLHYYQRKMGKKPEHIVFHRDGTGYDEEIEWIKEILSDQEITGKSVSFDYVSIVKECGRRMAYFDEIKYKMNNIPGTAYIDSKNQKAYLCLTDPIRKIGMAKPLKIIKHTGKLTLEQIAEDVYHLSFMNIHTDRKVRLPVTTNYADKSSTFFNRGYLSAQKEGIGFV
ncbi:Piwi domain-containing protein [Thermoactinomyces mirandus]|uniref:Protein argonaute n=1 Tax=Thermoactinomyces mirandus TaxID=2756294 RepID=A0A7W1XRZ0_9BACL|nr:Piwi domain-containing protein [Thermoactinomyces mirandus]MBA4602040.1 hypothetical protein [Thermoactinomyces mirandus]